MTEVPEENNFAEEGGPAAYPLQVKDVVFIGLRLTGNLLTTLAGGVHALANEVAAAANHQRTERLKAEEERRFAVEAVTALDRLTGGGEG